MLVRSRWERAATARRTFLTGMAEPDGDSVVEINQLAAHLGRTCTPDLSGALRELMCTGLIYSPECGLVTFAVPGMAGFITAQD